MIKLWLTITLGLGGETEGNLIISGTKDSVYVPGSMIWPNRLCSSALNQGSNKILAIFIH